MIRTTDTHAFFYTEWPSNFHRNVFDWQMVGFDDRPCRFFCTEQAFMYAKAKFFGDEEVASAIMKEDSDPMTVKSLGRMVSGYDDASWDAVRYDWMFKVNLERFKQNPDVRRKLLSKEYAGLEFVEASPSDRIWGVGLAQDDPKIDDPKNWRGKNLLGKVITQCRDTLLFL